MPRPTLALAGALTCCALAGLVAGQPQQTPVFRSGVDLVTVDVLVLDKSGKPVTDLKLADFTITAGGKARRVVAADYIPAVAPADVTPAPSLDRLVPGASSNATRRASRTFLFVVDTDEIRAGEGGTAMEAIGTFIKKLSPTDLVGLVSIPTGTPRLDPTTDRDSITRELAMIRGTDTRRNECEPTPGETVGAIAGDGSAAQAYGERVAGLGEKCRGYPPLAKLIQLAITRYQRHARNVLESVSALATAMAPVNGLKAVVLVSEGLLSDPDLADDLTRFGGVLEAARVRLYSIHLDAPLIEAGAKGSTIRTGLLDDRVGFDGMADAATFGGGEAFRAIASALPGLTRMEAELGGYYLLAFERDPVDKDQARLGLRVSVARPGADVRYRKNVTITSASPPAAADPRATIGRLLQTPGLDSAIRLDIASYALPNPRPATDARVMMVAEIANGPGVTAVGYEIADAAGKTVADSFDAPPRLVSIDTDRQAYVVTVPLTPGQYRLKLGVVNGAGGTGSLDHRFDVQPPKPGTVLLSDVVLGDDRSGALRPIARVTADMSRMIVRVDIDGPAGDLTSASARLRVVRSGDGESRIIDREVAVREAGDPALRRVVDAIDLAGLSAGTYEIAITLTTPSGDTIARRAFVVENRAGR